MNSIQVSENKTLKLMNVLSRRVTPEEMQNLPLVVTQMDNFIKARGATPVGPVIQKVESTVDAAGLQSVQFVIMRQANQMIAKLDPSYHMDGVLRVKNCLYAHYMGPVAANKMKLAYDKMFVHAFEHDIKLNGNNYTIFVSQTDDEAVTDVFMETC